MVGVGDYVVRGSDGGWELLQDGDVVASYRVRYRARVVRCDTSDGGTGWFLMAAVLERSEPRLRSPDRWSN